MERLDRKNIEKVGGILLDKYEWITSTGMTINEDYETDLIVNDNSGGTNDIEVKTIRKGKRPFKSRYIRDYTEESWYDNNFWLLNMEADTGRIEDSKWWKLTHGTYQGLAFYDEENSEIILYSISALKNAYRGSCSLWVNHTTDKCSERPSVRQWEKKAMIDLNKGKHISIK